MGLLQERLKKYDLPQQYMKQGVYPYFREIDGKQGTEVNMGGKKCPYVWLECLYRPDCTSAGY